VVLPPEVYVRCTSLKLKPLARYDTTATELPAASACDTNAPLAAE
jgi:hypothetical protein